MPFIKAIGIIFARQSLRQYKTGSRVTLRQYQSLLGSCYLTAIPIRETGIYLTCAVVAQALLGELAAALSM